MHKGPPGGAGSHCGSSADKAATLHVVVNSSSPSTSASGRPTRSPVGSNGGGGSTGVSPDSKQPQLLLMRVSSVKSSRSSDNESSNNNKRGAGKFTRINGRIYCDYQSKRNKTSPFMLLMYFSIFPLAVMAFYYRVILFCSFIFTKNIFSKGNKSSISF